MESCDFFVLFFFDCVYSFFLGAYKFYMIIDILHILTFIYYVKKKLTFQMAYLV